MKIMVTQEHIDKGVRMNGDSCPVSLAVAAATGRSWYFETRRFYPCASRDIQWLCRQNTMTLPHEVTRFIDDFDNRRPVQACVFDIPVEHFFPEETK